MPPVRQKLAISLILMNDGTQLREKIDREVVQEYADAKKAGAKFPEPDVFFDGEVYRLAGGFHRVSADILNGETHIFCNVHRGDLRKAMLFAVSENAAHGHRRSNADKRLAVHWLLEDDEWKKFSAEVIARKAKVSQPFVSELKRQMRAAGKDVPTKVISKKGVKVETRNVGKQKSATRTTAGKKIDVDAVVGSGRQAAPEQLPAFSLEPPAPDGFSDEKIQIVMVIRKGASAKRSIDISGRRGDDPPIFQNGVFNLAQLRPFPEPVSKIMALLQESYVKANAKKK